MDHFNLTFKRKENDQNSNKLTVEKILFNGERDKREGFTNLEQENQISPHIEGAMEDTPGKA